MRIFTYLFLVFMFFAFAGEMQGQINTRLQNNILRFVDGNVPQAFLQYTTNGDLSLSNSTQSRSIGINAQGPIFFKSGEGFTSFNQMVINSVGNVGINNDAPSERLDVAGNIEIEGNFPFLKLRNTQANSGNMGMQFLNSSGAQIGAIFYNENSDEISFNNGTGNIEMVIESNGNVGIGTTTPDQELDVNGDIALTDGTGLIEFKEGTTRKASFSYSGQNLTIKNDETDGDIVIDAADDIGFGTGTGTNRMFIRDDGNIGIGTTSPDQKLDVNGDIALTDGDGLIEFKEGATQKAFLSYNGANLTLENNETDGDIFIDAIDNMFLQAGSQTVLTVDSDQRVGIGDASPDFTLDISHPATPPTGSTGAGFSLRNTGGNNNDWRLYTDNTSGRLSFYENGNRVAAINESGSYSNLSDRRLKTDITYLDNRELKRIMQLKPASYKFKKLAKSDRRNYGLIAQELQEVYPDLVSSSVDAGHEKQYLGVSYSELIPILIAGIQEQQTQIEAKDERIEKLEQEMAELKNMMQQLLNKDRVQLTPDGNEPSEDIPSLQQNTPNPFNGVTTISYFVPAKATQATIQITDANGKVLERFEIAEAGHGTLEIDATRMQTGQYFYSLILDGKVFESKQMLLTK